MGYKTLEAATFDMGDPLKPHQLHDKMRQTNFSFMLRVMATYYSQSYLEALFRTIFL